LRRAQHYILVHEYHYVEGLLRKGQIEEKEVVRIKGEIERKLLALDSTALLSQSDESADHKRFIQKGGLADIFDTQDLIDAWGADWGDKLEPVDFPKG
jgi:hypothetical protein